MQFCLYLIEKHITLSLRQKRNMAIEIKSIPTLEGQKASLFIKMVEQESKKKIASKEANRIKTSAQKILEKAKF